KHVREEAGEDDRHLRLRSDVGAAFPVEEDFRDPVREDRVSSGGPAGVGENQWAISEIGTSELRLRDQILVAAAETQRHPILRVLVCLAIEVNERNRARF